MQPPFKLRSYKWCSVSSLTLIEYSSNKQRLWSVCAYAQAGLSLCWSHIPHCWKSHATALPFFLTITLNMCFGHSKEPSHWDCLLITHNICFGWEIRKIIFKYTRLSGGLKISHSTYRISTGKVLKIGRAFEGSHFLISFLILYQFYLGGKKYTLQANDNLIYSKCCKILNTCCLQKRV